MNRVSMENVRRAHDVRTRYWSKLTIPTSTPWADGSALVPDGGLAMVSRSLTANRGVISLNELMVPSFDPRPT